MKWCALVFVSVLACVAECTVHSFDQAWMLPYDRAAVEDCHMQFITSGKSPLCGVTVPAVHATPAAVGEFPHMAAIGWTHRNGNISWLCGGSLIWENFILTAAHCTENEDLAPPDVARLGYLYLPGRGDVEEVGQQLKIVNIIRHPQHRPSSRYYDLALLILEKNVEVNTVVIPACLWPSGEVRFRKFEAAGWGATGFHQPSSQQLLKVTLSAFTNEECSTYHNDKRSMLSHGIQDHQICAGDEMMDLCTGDSGGPLQVKLLQHNIKVPFLVGVTSFGKPCGHSAPGVFVRVSKFINWIRDTLRQQGADISVDAFHPRVCSYRHGYAHASVAAFSLPDVTLYNSVAKIMWPSQTEKPRTECYGILIGPDSVVTLAGCAYRHGSYPSSVELLRSSTTTEIRNVVLHPNYTEGSVYNNIAVLKVASISSVAPVCLNVDDRPMDSLDKLAYVLIKTQDSIGLATTNTSVFKNSSQRLCEEYRSDFSFDAEHLCFFSEEFLVPNFCEQLLGFPIGIGNNDGHDMFGMYMQGKDCGYGEPMIGMRLGAHRPWLASVLLKKRDSSVSFLDPDLSVGDRCRYADGTQGTCVPQANCSEIVGRIQHGQQIFFCRNGAVVCCPQKASTNLRIGAIEQELDECEQRYTDLSRKRSNAMTHIVEIGWQNSSNRSAGCIGYLISTRGVVTSASCLLESDTPYNVVRLHATEADGSSRVSRQTPSTDDGAFIDPVAWRNALREHYGSGRDVDDEQDANGNELAIENISIHPRYDKSTQSNNIAVVKLAASITPTTRVFPACLWQNVTHSPVHQEAFNSDLKLFNAIFPVYRSDCETILHRSLAAPEICMKLLWESYKPTCTLKSAYVKYGRNKIEREPNTHCLQAGNPVVWRDHQGENVIKQTLYYTEYLVGVYSSGHCESSATRIVERVAVHLDWLKEALQ